MFWRIWLRRGDRARTEPAGGSRVEIVPVPSAFPMRGRAIPFKDRTAERDVFERLLVEVRRGESRSLVVNGEPGVGKTALLEYLAARASGCRVIRVAGVQSEMELAFAGLHQLCMP